MNIWTRLGISVALAAIFCIVMLEVFQDKSFYDLYKWHICGAFLTLGIVLGLVGRAINGARRARYQEMRRNDGESSSDDDEEDGASEAEPFLLVNLAYWGVMLATFGVIIAFIVPTYKDKAQPVIAREPAKTNTPIATNVAVAPLTNAPTQPIIKLQGLVFREPNPSVLVNGRTYFVGEFVEDAKLVEIGPQSATFEWEGKRFVAPGPQ